MLALLGSNFLNMQKCRNKRKNVKDTDGSISTTQMDQLYILITDMKFVDNPWLSTVLMTLATAIYFHSKECRLFRLYSATDSCVWY